MSEKIAIRKTLQGPLLLLLTVVSIWLAQVFVLPYVSAYSAEILAYAGVNVILALSLNIINGFTGQFSMGHAGFMAVGAYTAAAISMALRPLLPEGVMNVLGFPIALVAGGLMTALSGLLVGLPSLRLKGDYLAIVTLGFGEIIRVVLLNIDSVGGARGLPGIPGYSSLGWIYSIAAVTFFVLWRVVYSSQGRSLMAVREDEIAAEAMGVHSTAIKVKAFVTGAFFAGVAGGLFAHYLRYLNPSIFDSNRSFESIIMVVMGGMGSLSGSVVAAMFLTILREALRPLQEITGVDLRMIIYSLLLIVFMLTRPRGFFGTREITMYLPRIKKLLRSRRSKQEVFV